MLNNERGSTLLVVMLMMMVFTVLGLSILSTSIGGAKRTEVREEQVTNDLDSIRNIGEAVAYIKKTIHDEFNVNDPNMSVSSYTNLINEILNNPYDYQISNISSLTENIEKYKIDENKDFTRVLEVSHGKYKQIVYITGMPSFLKYAVGSRGTLTLNGSTYVEQGNIYANSKLVISNQAKYIYGGENLIQETTFPSVKSKDNLLFVEDGLIEWCNVNCYQGVGTPFNTLSIDDIDNAFDPISPTFSKEETEYVDVDIERTFKEKLKVAGFLDENTDPYSMELEDIIKEGPSIETPTSFKDIGNDPTTTGYLFSSDHDIYMDTDELIIDKSRQWIVIDGNAIIENDRDIPMSVSANILVTGDLTIRGKIAFDSTIYVLGKTTINNVNISGYEDGQLILMTDDELEIARINKFTNHEENIIKAYLYTTKDAQVYAMGSYLYVDGGIFAKGNLEINAFRGTAVENEGKTKINFGSEMDKESSRLIIKNNKKLFSNQTQGLPKIDKLEVLTDLIKVE